MESLKIGGKMLPSTQVSVRVKRDILAALARLAGLVLESEANFAALANVARAARTNGARAASIIFTLYDGE
jgi:hypothetical protein